MIDDEYLDFYNDNFNDPIDLYDVEEISLESSEEAAEESSEENAEESSEEVVGESVQSSIEVYGTVEIGNYDTFSTPLNQCSSVTISLCLIIFFVMLATIGGVLVD